MKTLMIIESPNTVRSIKVIREKLGDKIHFRFDYEGPDCGSHY